ncbi:hypothetical protein AA313_de0202246 [Arthrobotrys entomopaga]|nr:hypothetical protein AA313_de0202246 [Arthrobotrys entomopaga]
MDIIMSNIIFDKMERMDISLSDIVRFFYFNAILITITLNVFPPFAKKLYTYGKNQDTRHTKDIKSDINKDGNTNKDGEGDGLFDRCLNLLASLQLPHHYFTHFYALSTALQLFTLVQILTHGRLLLTLLPLTNQKEGPQQSFESIILCIICMILQSSRRLYESLYIQLPSSSTMSILIYSAGILHYIFMSLATWCESPTTTLLTSPTTPLLLLLQLHPSDLLKPPRINTLLAFPCFIMAAGVQHDAQVHLSSLKKYSVPTHPLFGYTLSPHYLAECVIYGSLVVLGAPDGEWVNVTLLYVWVFVCVNQAFGAGITRGWYRDRFGEKAVEGKYRLLPFVF